MDRELLKQRLIKFCKLNNIQNEEKVVDYSVRFLESLKEKYKEFSISDNSFLPYDNILRPHELDVKEKYGQYSLDELLLGRLIRNLKKVEFLSDSKDKNLLNQFEGMLGVYIYFNRLIGTKDDEIKQQTEFKIKQISERKNLFEKTKKFSVNFSKDAEVMVEIEDDLRMYDLVYENLSVEEKKAGLSRIIDNNIYSVVAHELYHVFQTFFYPDGSYSQYGYFLKSEKKTAKGMMELYNQMHEVIHDYQVMSSIDDVKDNYHRVFAYTKSGMAFHVNNIIGNPLSSYAVNADLAQILELIFGKETLFYAMLERRNDIVQHFNKMYKNVFETNGNLMFFHHEFLRKLYDVNGSEPWDVLCTYNHYSKANKDSAEGITVHDRIQAALIDCLTFNVNRMKPQKKNEKTLLRMKEYLENVYKTVNIVRIKEIPFIKKETNSTNAFNKLAKSVKIKEAEVNNQIKHLGHQTDVVYSSDEEILTDTSDRTVTDDNVIEIPS